MTLLDHLFDVYDKFQSMIARPFKLSGNNGHHWVVRIASGLIVILILIQIVFGFLWNNEPDAFRVVENAASMSSRFDEDMVTGYITVATTITVAEALLDSDAVILLNHGMTLVAPTLEQAIDRTLMLDEAAHIDNLEELWAGDAPPWKIWSD